MHIRQSVYMLASLELSETEKMDWIRLIRSENVGPATFINLSKSIKLRKKHWKLFQNSHTGADVKGP